MKKPLYYTLMAIFCAIFLVCAGLLIRYAIRSEENSSGYDDLASRFHGFTNSTTRFLPTTSTPGATAWSTFSTTLAPTTGTTAPTLPPTTIPTTAPPATTLPTLPSTTQPTVSWPPDSTTMMENMAMLYELNNHTVGWLSIPGAGKYLGDGAGYPVMQTPNTPEWRDYYLTHTFKHENIAYGAIYAQEACDIFGPSDNITLYGHNMADGQMFGFLNNYDRKPQETYEKHKYICFDTLYGCHTYEIFAIFNTSGTLGVGFPYHTFTDAKDQADFDNFVNTIRELSKIETDLVPRYGDKLLCLSTCSGQLANGRLVVVAVRIA